MFDFFVFCELIGIFWCGFGFKYKGVKGIVCVDVDVVEECLLFIWLIFGECDIGQYIYVYGYKRQVYVYYFFYLIY